MRTGNWQTSLTYRLGRTVLPLSAVAALLLALSAPIAWFALKYTELNLKAEGTAARVSAELGQFVHESPRLWPYNSPKMTQRMQSLLTLDSETYVAVVGPSGDRAFERDPDRGPYLWHQEPLPTADGTAGWVVVGVSAADFLTTALTLLAGFALLGGVVAGLLYMLPMKAMRSTEEQLSTTLNSLSDAQQQLRGVNEDLERRVREKTEGLVEAHDQLTAQQETLQRLAASLYNAQEEERHRIAADLHDSVGQMLTAIRVNLETAGQMQEEDATAPPLGPLLQHTSDLVNQTTDSIRQAIHLLGPPQLQEGGLRRALQALERQLELTPYEIVIDDSGLPVERLPAALEDLAFRIIQEALNNALRHGGADVVRLRLVARDGVLAVVVEDNGSQGRQVFKEGHGLASLRDRVQLLGGVLKVEPLPNGHALAASIPIHAAESTNSESHE
jgi:signal transduction histidine kinase